MRESLKNTILELRNSGLTYGEISSKLGCSKSVISFHCRKENLDNPNLLIKPKKNEIFEFEKLYEIHKSLEKVADITGWSSSTIKKYVKKRFKKTYKISKSDAVINWRKRTKEKLVNYKGGKCEICGYNKCVEALQFHHENPKEKDFQIGGKSWSYDRLVKEVDKCKLLCSNCHIETHKILRG
jgi:DNA-binding CsgD family transcriptional regulator